MARKRTHKSNGGIFDTIWKLVKENPQVAIALAFEIGALVAETTRRRGDVKKMLMRQLGTGATLLPQLVAKLGTKVPSALRVLAVPALEAAMLAHGTPNASKKVARARNKTRL